MNIGIMSTRYATALLRYVQESGAAERVSTQVVDLLYNGADMASVKLEPELERFVTLLVEQGRLEYVRLIFHTFLGLYAKSAGIKLVHLVSAVKSSELEEKVRRMIEQQTGCKVVMDATVDPSLIGGFTVEVDDYMLDASVSRQIESIRRQFVIKNNRLV